MFTLMQATGNVEMNNKEHICHIVYTIPYITSVIWCLGLGWIN